ncbi:ferruginol synthase-like [Pyrus communis]|uniref:ferruginol synthase-like n=1 Tax=Pyrus communis TaxID=23211 RepID=UPI0035C2226E
MEAFPLCMIIALLSVAEYFFITRLVHRGKYENWKNSPPGPVGWPILGNLLQLSSSEIHEHLFKLSKIHGPLFSLKLGPKPVIVAASPEMARLILKEQEAVFSSHIANKIAQVVSYDDTSLVHGLLKQLYSASSAKNLRVFITIANITSNLACSKSLFEYTTKEGGEMKRSLRELVKALGLGNVADFFSLFKPFDPQGLKRRTLAIFRKLFIHN